MLQGAMFEYLDDGELDEMINDMNRFLTEEEEKLTKMVNMYKKARKILCGDKK
jgi:hypothetical protein